LRSATDQVEEIRTIATLVNGSINKRSKATNEADIMTDTSDKQRDSKQANDKSTICAFHVNAPEADLTGLRRRINIEGARHCVPA
jgi:hypothetical protein